VHATIHPDLQRAAEAALQEGLSRYERNAGRVDFRGPETNLAAAVATATVSEPAAANEPPWQRALKNARLPLYDVHWTAAIVIEEASSKNGRTVRVGVADGRVLPLSLGRVAPSKLKAHDVVLVRLIEGKGKAARAELRVRPVVQGSVIVLENQSGRILAMTGGFSYPISQLNRVTQAQRQPGSSLKPLVYLAALQRGLQPNTLVRDDTVTYPPIGGSKKSRPEDFWTPKNYDGGDGGILTIRQALETSKNLPTARLLDGIEASPPQSLDYICKLAQHLKIYKECMPYYPFVLGAQPVRPLDLAVFYATIANEGTRPTPYSIDKITRGDKTVYQHEAPSGEVTKADNASFYQLKTMMQGVLARGTARSLSHIAPYVAGKTGTTDGENDVWFVGFSNDVTVAVWVGYDNADGHRRTLGAGRTGGGVAIPIFEPVMQAVWSHHAPKSALRPASPEAKRDLVVPQRKEAKSTKAALLPEYLRRDAKGRTVNAQYRLVSRRDQEALASAKRKPREQSEDSRHATEGRDDPWFGRRQSFGWQGWDDGANFGGRRSGGRGFW
jgi:penicillin-binding protein 1A